MPPFGDITDCTFACAGAIYGESLLTLSVSLSVFL